MSEPRGDRFFAVTAPGLAPITAGELQRLGLVAVGDNYEPGGVEFAGAQEALYRANLHLATPSRILLRLGEFEAIGFVDLRRRAAKLPWERCLGRRQPIAIRVTCTKSRLYHSDAVAERVVASIGDRLGSAPAVLPHDEEGESAGDANPPQLVVVRLLHDHCTISVDTSGALLHRRGYRLATAKAPLRETLAAGMILAAGWDPAAAALAPLVDPFCGSGTLPIEAARLALGIAPGADRRFAFMDWPSFDRDLWKRLLAEAEAQHRRRTAALPAPLPIFGSDRDDGAITAAQENAERAGIGGAVAFTCQAVSAVQFPPGPGWVVTNPPYGVRVSEGKDLRNLYAQFGKHLRSKAPGWRFAVLSNDRSLLGQMGLRIDSRLSLVNGGIAVTLALGTV